LITQQQSAEHEEGRAFADEHERAHASRFVGVLAFQAKDQAGHHRETETPERFNFAQWLHGEPCSGGQCMAA
jgi:hypothetical protein